MGSSKKKSRTQIVKEILDHQASYHGDDAPKVSDYDYDMLVQQLYAIDKKHGIPIKDTEKVLGVGYQIKKEFREIDFMLSRVFEVFWTFCTIPIPTKNL